MSIVSPVHTFAPYTGKETALTGQRLVKITFKTDKETGIKPESKCVSVPPAAELLERDLLDNWEVARPVVMAYFETVQDSIVRGLVTEGRTDVRSDELGLWACLAAAQAESSGGRLSKELLTGWFEGTAWPALKEALFSKLGVVNNAPTLQQSKVLEVTAKRFLSWVTAMASPKTLLTIEAIEQVTKLVGLIEGQDAVAEKITARLTAMLKAHEQGQDEAALL